MDYVQIPSVFQQLQTMACLTETDLVHTQDGFYLAYRPLSDIPAFAKFVS